MVAAQLMDAEITAQIGAGHGEVSADRVTHRNGYRSRGWCWAPFRMRMVASRSVRTSASWDARDRSCGGQRLARSYAEMSSRPWVIVEARAKGQRSMRSSRARAV